MQFSSPLIRGRLLKRYKRFLADVELGNGELVTAHCPNTGAMTGCAEPGCEVWLSHSTNPKRKLAYTWELTVTDQHHWIGINTHNANKLVVEGIAQGRIPELNGYSQMRTEVKYGQESSRIDILLEDPHKPAHYVEIKSVTLLQQGEGFFPDAKTARGVKHLRELAAISQMGCQASLLFCVQHTGIKTVEAASHIDPEYARLLTEVHQQGVQVLAYDCQINQEKIEINQSLRVLGLKNG